MVPWALRSGKGQFQPIPAALVTSGIRRLATTITDISGQIRLTI